MSGWRGVVRASFDMCDHAYLPRGVKPGSSWSYIAGSHYPPGHVPMIPPAFHMQTQTERGFQFGEMEGEIKNEIKPQNCYGTYLFFFQLLSGEMTGTVIIEWCK